MLHGQPSLFHFERGVSSFIIQHQEAETALAKMGAKITNSVSSKTNYLIVGGLGSDRWKFNNGGGKIQQATQLGVKILPETAISSLLKEAQNV